MPDLAPPTDEQLAAWQALCDAATPGEWIAQYGGGDWTNRIIFVRGGENTLGSNVRAFIVRTVDTRHEDAALIVAARAAMPLLLAEVQRLRAKE